MSLKRTLMQKAGGTVLSLLGTLDILLTGRSAYPGKDENQRNPYIWLKALRARGPVVRTYANRGWMVVGFEAVQAAFLDPRFSSDMRASRFLTGLLRAAADGEEVQLLDDPSMLNLDAPDHTRLRKLVSHGFLRRYIESLEPRIAQIVDRCLDEIDPAADRFDLMEALAKPLPAIVIAELLGLPEADREQFQAWSTELLGVTHIDDPQAMEIGNRANNRLRDYFAEVIADKRRHPSQDLIGQLIAAEEEGDRLTAEEMYSTCNLLLLAGHETTTRLIGNGMHALLQHPEQVEMLRRDASLIPNAVEEMLRYEAPVQMMPRLAVEDMSFHGARIRKGQLVMLVIGSANRDDAANPDADVFDIRREKVRHVSFGYGIHLCLGLALARLEARVAIKALLDRYPLLELADEEVDWQPGPLVRGMDHLLLGARMRPAQAA